MKLPASVLGILSLIATLACFAAPAHAQATRTWVSGVGDDANPCSRTAPCKTFAGAISKTAAGGEINCIDPGGFGAVTIVKAMTIDCANIEAGVVVAGTNGVIVNAGVSDVVVLRGIDFMGTLSVPGLNGVRFIAGGALHIEKCLIREFTSAAPNGFGVLFQPSGTSKMFISDTVITNNISGAVMVRPTGAGSANVQIVNTNGFGNGSGFTADTSGGPTTGGVTMLVRESSASGNAASGFSAISSASSGTAGLLVDHSATTLNATGVSAAGAKSVVLVGSSSILSNANGLSVSGGGQVFSFGNNQVSNTAVGGSFISPTLPPQ